MIILRPYQQKIASECIRELHHYRSVLIRLGTGGGKTATIAEVIRRKHLQRPDSYTVFCAPLDSIVEDTHERIVKAGLQCGIYQAGRKPDPTAHIQVASLQTLAKRDAAMLPPADMLVLDEAQHAPARSIQRALNNYRRARLIGLSATPQRGDGLPLGDTFQYMVEGPSNAELVEQGFLVPCELIGPQSDSKALACSPLEAWQRWTPGRRTIVFCRTVTQAKRHADEFTRAGISAAVLSGQSPKRARREIRAKLLDGTVQVLCVANIAREGFDCPCLEVAIFACKCGVIGSWLQMIGRISRPCEETGKTVCTVIDLAGSWIEMGLRDDPRKWSLTGDAVVSEKIPPIQRCKACAAIFPPRKTCPRCGADHVCIERVQRVLSRVDRLAVISDIPQYKRDEMYLRKLECIAVDRLGLEGAAVQFWAMKQFRKRHRGPLRRAS
mgnify:CR=1 FL=1